MNKRKSTLSGLVAAVLCAAWCASAIAPASAQEGADAQTTEIVRAADAFLASLSDAQKDAVLYEFTDAEQRANWSNLPVDMFARGGIAWGQLDDKQRAALVDVLTAVLSPEGVVMVEAQMAADERLAANDSGGPRLTFGSDHYYVSFLGTPSTTEPWMFQFGGHHLAINATVVGSNLTLSPSLTGGQPLKFTREGEEVYIVEVEVHEAATLMNSLTEEQREAAVLGNRRIDLVLGPGKDGITLQPEGLPGAEMTDSQKALFLGLIETRLGIMNADDLAAKMAAVREKLDRTFFAWFGPTDQPAASYWRVTGPTVVIEFSPQEMGGDLTQHAHNMYRDPTNEYGAAWTPLD